MQKAQKRVADLEAELDEAWRVVEELAREVDAMGVSQDGRDIGEEIHQIRPKFDHSGDDTCTPAVA